MKTAQIKHRPGAMGHRWRGAWVGCCLVIAWSAQAADTPEPAPSPKPAAAAVASADRLASARQQIQAKQWRGALEQLKRVNDTASADWNNLMGYVLRKSAPPDLAGAERHYNEALRINPKHLGALEYSGELYLMQGDLAKAEARLQTLAQACAARCEEHADLAGEIERFKRNGQRWVAKP